MTEIVQLSNEIFGGSCPVSCEEILYKFLINYRIKASALPSADQLTHLCNECLDRDNIEIQFHSVENFCFLKNANSAQSDAYAEYKSQLEQDDFVEVTVKIQKEFADEIISVYNIEEFTEFLCGQTMEENFLLFAKLFGEKQHICFQILNCDCCLHTSSIAFASGSLSWDNSVSRDAYIRNCNDSSVFLGRAQYPLVPQDFTICEQVNNNRLDRIKGLFDKLRNVLSYLYIANTSNVVGGKAVLQFDPAVNPYEYTLEQLSGNSHVWEIYHWVHKDDACVDRASIARNIINIHCKTSDEILNIDENIYNSAVANHVIYQKKHADQYIELKNKLSEFIVESAAQLQELAHDLVEGFRNNFVAVIVFLMTVLLTDSIDFSNFTQANVTSNIVAVCGIFTFASLLYMIVTIIAGNVKWGWLDKSYKNLKDNYNGILDEQDIENAVNNDAAFNNTKEEYKHVRLTIGCIWALAVIGMMIFTIVIGYNSRKSEASPVKTYQSDEQVIDPSETGTSETDGIAGEDENSTDISSVNF